MAAPPWRLLWWWYAPVRWKSTFSQRTLRPLLVERASSKFKYCSLLANIELVCLHGSIVLMCSPWLTNHSNPIWNKWTITVAVKARCFELTFRTKQKSYWPASQTLLDFRDNKCNKLRRVFVNVMKLVLQPGVTHPMVHMGLTAKSFMNNGVRKVDRRFMSISRKFRFLSVASNK